MAAIFKRFFVPLGILTLGLIGFEVQSFLHQSTFAQAQNVVMIPVSLPEKVTVNLKCEGTISGVRLLEINSQTQQINLQQGGNTESKEIASIESLTFSGRAIIRGGKVVIRGGTNVESNCGNSENWTLPLNHVQLRDSEQAEINLASISKGRQREIGQIDETRTYVVDEMKFETPGRVNLKITPCSSN